LEMTKEERSQATTISIRKLFICWCYNQGTIWFTHSKRCAKNFFAQQMDDWWICSEVAFGGIGSKSGSRTPGHGRDKSW
jgi:hypothetical protein